MPCGLLSNLRAIAAGKQIFLFESPVSPFSKHNSLCEFYRPSSSFISDSNSQLGNFKNKGALGVVSLACLGLAASGFSCQIFEHHTKRMAASGSAVASGGLKVDSLITRCGNISSLAKTRAVYFADRSIQGFQKARVGIKRRESNNSSRAYGYFIVDASPRFYNFSSLSGMRLKRYQTSLSPCYSDGAVPNVLSSGSSFGEEVGSLAISADQQALAERSLKLLSGSCYLPHPDKEGTGGEDAHFICVDEQAIGVADGVGGWADVGVNAGEYSRQLMYNSVKAIQDEPGDCIDTARVLEKAYSITMARGSSTACIIALTKQGLHAINLGDSGFIVVRDGCTIFQSPVQQHSFNFTYQLECGNRADLPSSGQVFTIPVATGDVIVAGTDGLFDNLYNNEINAIVVHAIRAGFTPEVTAQKIAALARQRAQERDRQTPFSTAAQEAGFRYYGGKLDDITVAVSYITGSANK